MKANHRMMSWIGVLGVGLLPCPDCGLPLGVKIWPIAAVIWAFRRIARRSLGRMDLLLTEELGERAAHTHGHDHTAGHDEG